MAHSHHSFGVLFSHMWRRYISRGFFLPRIDLWETERKRERERKREKAQRKRERKNWKNWREKSHARERVKNRENVTTPLGVMHASDNDEKFKIISTLDQKRRSNDGSDALESCCDYWFSRKMVACRKNIDKQCHIRLEVHEHHLFVVFSSLFTLCPKGNETK